MADNGLSHRRSAGQPLYTRVAPSGIVFRAESYAAKSTKGPVTSDSLSKDVGGVVATSVRESPDIPKVVENLTLIRST